MDNMLCWIFTSLIMVSFTVFACFAFNKKVEDLTKVIVGWICLGVIAALDILTYAFAGGPVASLVIGLSLFTEIIVQACSIVIHFRDDESDR